MQKRRSQAERRKSTQAILLTTAEKLFGENGYANTSLEDIACEDPIFRQIILVDGPTVLGTGTLREGEITKAALKNSAQIFGTKPDGLRANMMLGALSYASLFIAEHGADTEDYKKIRDFINYFSEFKKDDAP